MNDKYFLKTIFLEAHQQSQFIYDKQSLKFSHLSRINDSSVKWKAVDGLFDGLLISYLTHRFFFPIQNSDSHILAFNTLHWSKPLTDNSIVGLSLFNMKLYYFPMKALL